jgi:hypothetical protein
MSKRILIFLLSLFALGGCVAQYALVAPGAVTVESLTVQAGSGWNNAPAHQRVYSRPGSSAWTKDGLLLDRLVMIPAVADGEPLLIARDKAQAMPVFRADMLPNELEELVESSIVKFFGEGQAVVNTSNLRPQRFGDDRGVMFDLTATVTESPEYRGVVGAFVADDKLYVIYFLGATPYYYEKHVAEATAVITSARIQSRVEEAV